MDKKISELSAGTPLNTDYIPYVDGETDETKKALKSELKGETGDNATADAGSTTTLAAGESATVSNVGTTSDAVFDFGIPQGIQGEDGAKITSVAFSGNNIVFTLDDASTVTLTDAKLDLKGEQGDVGAKTTGASFVGDDMVFTLDDSSTVTLSNAKVTLKGATGLTGSAGTITSIIKTDTTGLVDTYTVTYNDDTTTTFTVTNGADGAGSGDTMSPATNTDSYLPQWDGANSKTLKNGVALPVGGLAGLTEVGNKIAKTTDVTAINDSEIADGEIAVFNKTNKDIRTSDKTIVTTLGADDTTIPTSKAIADKNYLTAHQDISGKANIASPTFTGKVTTPAIKITTGAGAGKILQSDASGDATWETPAAGGASLWTAITATRVSNTTCTVVGDQTAIFKKGMIIRWTESSVDKVAMVSIPSTYSSVTTITFIGDTMASVTAFKYSSLIGAEQFIARFAYAGNVGATANDVMNAYYATEPMKVIGADLQVGTAGTTNATTIDINKAGTSMFTTKPTLATTIASSPLPFTSDTTSALALGDRVSIDVDAIQTTNSVDLYVQLYLFPTRFLTLE